MTLQQAVLYCPLPDLLTTYRLTLLLQNLNEPNLPPLGTLIFQFNKILHPYYRNEPHFFLDESGIPPQLNNFLVNFFVQMFEKNLNWTTLSPGNVTAPQLSLYDVPHLLTDGDLLATRDQYYKPYFAVSQLTTRF